MPNNTIKFKKSAIANKTPLPSNMEYGELYVNYASGYGKIVNTIKIYRFTINNC